MTVENTQQNLSTAVEKTEQVLGGLENSLGNNVGGRLRTNGEQSENNTGLPEWWAECLVGDYLFLKNGYAFKSNMYTEKSDGTFPIIRISDVDGRIASDAKAIHVSSGDVVDGFEVCNGDLLIAMSGATTGKVGIYKGALAYQNQRVGNIKLHSDELGNKVYKNYLIANLTPDILKAAYGGAQPNVSGKAIEGIKISLPPLAEQTVIAQTLDTLLAQVDNIKTHLDAIPKILKTFRQSVLAAAVSGKLTEEWRGENECEIKSLGDVSKDIRYGTSKKCSEEIKLTPVLRIPNIGDRGINLDKLKYADFDKKEIEKLKLNQGDILIIRSNGSVELVGKSAVITSSSVHCLFAGYLIRVRLDQDKALPEYVDYCLKSPQIRSLIEVPARSTSGVNNINSKELAALKIPFPTIEEQTEIVRRVEELFTFADQIEQQVKNAQKRVNTLTQSILAKAFRGELTAQWRAENPDLITGENSAEALLANIQVERDALKQKAKSKKAVKKKATPKKLVKNEML